MAKGFYVYDPNTKEFRTRHAGRPWAMDDASAIATMDAAGEHGQGESESGMPPMDPTPMRLGRPARAARPPIRDTGYEGEGPRESQAWRWIMWVLIAVMAVTWLVMIGKQVLQTRESAKDEHIFQYDAGATPE